MSEAKTVKQRNRDLINQVASSRSDLPVLNTNVAGIDVGSTFHYLAVAPEQDARPVRKFGCTTPELRGMASWLASHGVTSVALEATGIYWMPVHRAQRHRVVSLGLV